MNLKNCPECGKVYLENPRGLCPACIEEEEQDALKVMEYLREVKKASVTKIHEDTGIREKIILRMMHHGLLIGNFEIGYACDHCGGEIYEGRLCSHCSQNLINQIKPAYQDKQPEESARQREKMYTSDITRNR